MNQKPEFWAMIKATLLVPGWSLMNPHSLWRGLLLSAWNALNLRKKFTTFWMSALHSELHKQ